MTLVNKPFEVVEKFRYLRPTASNKYSIDENGTSRLNAVCACCISDEKRLLFLCKKTKIGI
jgi:hypothetical protein